MMQTKMTHAPPDDAAASIVGFTPAQVRDWFLVLDGLRLTRLLGWILVAVSGLCPAALMLVDRSDRGGVIVFVAFVHAAFAAWQLVSLILCCLAPAESETRRRARQTELALGVAVGAILAFCVGLTLWRHYSATVIPTRVMSAILLIFALTLVVCLAMIGRAWFLMHAALGRDLGDPLLEVCAVQLARAWLAYCAVVAAQVLWHGIGRLDDLPAGSFGVSAAGLAVIEGFYLRLVARSCQALQLTICDTAELHARGDSPAMPTRAATRLQE